MKILYTMGVWLLLGLSASFIYAQPEESKKPNVSIEFTIIGMGGDLDGLAYHNGGRVESLEITGFRRSKVYKYNGPADMGLYLTAVSSSEPKETSSSSSPAKPVHASKDAVGVVTFPATVKRVTVLLSKAGAKDYRSYVMEDDDEKFPAGSARLLNLSDTRLAIRFDKRDTVMLAPRESHIVAPAADEVLFIQVAREKEGKWVSLMESRIPVPTRYQTSIFFLKSEDAFFKSLDGQTLGEVPLLVLRDSVAK